MSCDCSAAHSIFASLPTPCLVLLPPGDDHGACNGVIQLALQPDSDLMGSVAGMHGAAMAWTLLMSPHAAAVELWPQPEGIWRCYEHFAHWAGLLYR